MSDTEINAAPNADPAAPAAGVTAVPEEPHTQDPADEQTDTRAEKGTAGEAARYRRRLRDTEAERDQLRGRVEHLQRGEIERLAAGRLTDPADIWRDGAQLADLTNDDGHIDPAKVNATLDALLKAHGHWGIQQSYTAPPRQGSLRSGASTPAAPRRDAFTKAFAPPER